MLRFAKIGFALLGALFLLWATWATRAEVRDIVFVETPKELQGDSAPSRKVFFEDADCYSRMTRVAAVMAQPGLVLKQHAFENAPLGTHPHTTALLDYLIAIPGWMVGAEVAGAWISPVLGLLLLAFLGFWLWREKLVSGAAWALITLTLSPMIVQAFHLGRPDHQGLLLMLLGIALAAELGQLRAACQVWAIAAGAGWGFALWTSLYEPIVFLLASVVLVAVLGRTTWSWRSRAWELGVFLGIIGIALTIEGGVRITAPGTGADKVHFTNWAKTIYEMTPPGAKIIQLLPAWLGWMVFAAPVFLALSWRRTRDPRVIYAGALLVLTFILATMQLRWAPFFCLAYVLAVPFQFGWLARKRGWENYSVHAAFAIFLLIPMAYVWDGRTKADGPDQPARREQMLENLLAWGVARVMINAPARSPEVWGRNLIAPYWLTPKMTYWSGVPGVAGSSHQALPGTRDVSQFYLGTDWLAAAQLLRVRDVRWVVAYEPARILQISALTLGDDAPKPSVDAEGVSRAPLAVTLYDRPGAGPNYLKLIGRGQFFVLYEVQPEIVDRWLDETGGTVRP